METEIQIKLMAETQEKARLFDEIERRRLMVNCTHGRVSIFTSNRDHTGATLLDVMREVCR